MSRVARQKTGAAHESRIGGVSAACNRSDQDGPVFQLKVAAGHSFPARSRDIPLGHIRQQFEEAFSDLIEVNPVLGPFRARKARLNRAEIELKEIRCSEASCHSCG